MFPTENPSPSCCPQTSQPRICSNEEVDNTPLPQFSIRDFVSSNRRKGIANHWPFSPKHLQLCFKNSVRDVLPPFRAHRSFENNYLSCKKLALDVENRESIESEKDKQNQSTSLEAENLREIPASYPSEDPELLESVEKMASKVCPVCKTFSSPSNTALNAHIDRCLSGESTSKEMEISKAAKHRMKVRKTRSMADIYVTSMECTLEDLDRRNGTNWAENPFFPTQEDVDDEKDISPSFVNSEDERDQDDVYVDSNGTKLRILSRFDDLQSKLDRKDKRGRGKHCETGNGSKLKSSTMERASICQLELPKCPLSRQTSLSHMTREDYSLEKDNKTRRNKSTMDDDKEGSPEDRMTSGDFAMIKQWVGSKRTIAKRKINPEFESHHQSHRLRKRYRRSVMESSFYNGKKSDLSEQSRKDDPSCLDPSSSAENRGSSQCDGSPFLGTRMRQHRKITSESLKNSSLDGADLSVDKDLSSLRTIAVCRQLENQHPQNAAARVAGGSNGSLLESRNAMANISFHNPATSGVDVHVAGEAFTIFGKSMGCGFRDNSGDYVMDVDPIPIPGPPGSFLPSPGHTCSEEIHGDSSLTACKPHSSEGEIELIDINSSDSPISSRLDPKFVDESKIKSIPMLFTNTPGVSSGRGSFDYRVPFPPLGRTNVSTGDATIEVVQNSRPVLRLMGKNLTVVNNNKDEIHSSPQAKANWENYRSNLGIPDLPPNPSGDVNTFYNIYQTRCFSNYDSSQALQGSIGRAMPFNGLIENSNPESLTSASSGLVTTLPRSSSLWLPRGFSMPKS